MAFYICNNCGFGSASWLGRCPDCGQFNTLKQQPDFDKKEGVSRRGRESIKKIKLTSFKKIKTEVKGRIKTGKYEFDRVLGGGIVPGEVILLSGEPGVGKSTLLLQTLHKIKTAYISGEEAPEQIKERAERLGIDFDNFLFSDDLQIEGIVEGLEEMKNKIDVVVIDSIQTVYSKSNESSSGSVNQLKECTSKLIYLAKKTKMAVIIVGHITKVGEIAGPKTIEHAVDCVLNFEGEKISNYRILRSSKNRFGPTDEIGIFEMMQQGLKEISNPLVFIDEETDNVSGKAIVGVTEGKRSLFYEVQSLVTPTIIAFPRRVVNGLDYNRVLLLLAVIRKHLHLYVDKFDIYINVVGGVNVRTPAADLGIIAAIFSSFQNTGEEWISGKNKFKKQVQSGIISKNTVFIGEVGLLGEIRKVYQEEKIVGEAKRLGFKHIYSSLNLKHIKDLKRLFFS